MLRRDMRLAQLARLPNASYSSNTKADSVIVRGLIKANIPSRVEFAVKDR